MTATTEQQPQPQPQPQQRKQPKGTQQSQRRRNDPKRVDTLMGWCILGAVGMCVGLVFFLNIGPYRDLMFNVLFNWGWLNWVFTVPLLGAMIQSAGQVIALVLAVCLFAGIQLAEIWPMVSADSDRERNSDQWGHAMRFRVGLACIAYGLDAIACSAFWPPLAVPFEQFRWAALLGDIAWMNIVVSLVTLFGLSAYVWLHRAIARVM